MKDIFVDADSATNFPNPPNESFAKFVKWLLEFKEGSNENACLIVSPKLLSDYFGGCRNSMCRNAIASIYDKLDFQKRVIKKSNKEVQDFIDRYYTQRIWDKLRCKRPGSNDPYHIALIYLSSRKKALTSDKDLTHDLKTVKFKKIDNTILVDCDPDKLDYL